jgi:hypothetical protein
MKRTITVLSLTIVALVGASPRYTPNASSKSIDQLPATLRDAAVTPNLMPAFVTTLSVDRADDAAAASACTVALNDCSLRGAVIRANTTPGPDPVVINLKPATTYNLTISNANQENSGATGDLDITTSAHPVTIVGGGSAGVNASIIDAAGLSGGGRRDRVFHLTGSNVKVTLQNLVIRNGQAGDNGTAGTSTNPTAQNTNREGGGILNNGGSLTLDKVVVQSCQAIGKGDSVINESTTLEGAGGGLFSRGATANVIVLNSTFTSNTAAGGNGGNFNNGVGSWARGGSIYFEAGTLTIDGSRIEKSTAIGGNGGNQDQSGQTNGGIGGMALGGGVYVGGGAASINNTTFKSTVAIGGNSGTAGNGANFAGGADGGGLYSLGNVKVLNSTFHLAGATGGNGGNAFGPTCLGGHVGGDGGPARGGAIFADGGTMAINTATFANNFATGGHGGNGGQTNGGLNCGQHGAGGLAHGAAIANNNAATVNIKHSTISLNNATAGNTGVNQGGANKPPRPKAEGTGGGIRVGPASVTVENTIIAGNTAANGAGDAAGAPVPGPNVDGTVISNGHNLLGVATDAGGFVGPGDLTGANPALAALADNGGPTETMALSTGSAAIDKGVAAGATLDQRGQPRTFDAPGVANAPTSDGTDIGAYELQPLCNLSCPANISVPNDKHKCGAVVNYKKPTGTGCGTVTCQPASGSFFPVGDTTVTCTSSVGPTCSFKVTVKDTQPPVITTKTMVLWPPNHNYRTVNVSDLVVSVTDNCGRKVGIGSVRIVKVTSDEPENAPGAGDGNTTNDIVIAADCKSVQLRAERKNNGNGRVYTLTFKVTDPSGNTSTATAKVTVKHSQNGAAAVDDGPSYTVTSACP